MTTPARYTPKVTVAPVQVIDLTGLQEEVLYALGRASRRGTLVRAEPLQTNPDGTVTVRAHYTVEPPALPRPMLTERAPRPSGRERWETWDYVYAGLIVLGLAATAATVWVAYLAVLAVCAWIAAHLTVILISIAVLIGLIIFFGRSASCAGIITHCGGCRG